MDFLKSIGEWAVNFYDSLDPMSQAILIFFSGVVAFIIMITVLYLCITTKREVRNIVLKNKARATQLENAVRMRRERERRERSIRDQY